MADRWLHAGSGLPTLRVLTGGPTEETNSFYFDSAYVDVATGCTGSASASVAADFVDTTGASDSVGTGEVLWFHTAVYHANNGAANAYLEVLDGSDQPWVAVRYTTTSGTFGLYYNSGTGGSPTWTLIGSTFTIPTTGRKEFDLKVTLGSPHAAEFFVDAVSVASGTFTQASFSAAHAVGMRGPSGANTARWSEHMASVGINTVGGRCPMVKPSAAGSNSGFTSGAYTDIDDTSINDADLISSATAGQRSTFAYGNLPTLAGDQQVGDLFLYTRAKNDGAAPLGMKPVRRDSGAVDNVGSAVTVTSGFLDYLKRYSGLSATEINASEFGVESNAT